MHFEPKNANGLSTKDTKADEKKKLEGWTESPAG